MSKLSENLKAYATGARVAHTPSMSYVSFESKSYELTPYSLQYNLDCTLRSSFIIGHTASHALQTAISKAKRAILEEIFGEFRKDLYELDHALYNQDIEKAKKHLDSVMKNMFDY